MKGEGREPRRRRSGEEERKSTKKGEASMVLRRAANSTSSKETMRRFPEDEMVDDGARGRTEGARKQFLGHRVGDLSEQG